MIGKFMRYLYKKSFYHKPPNELTAQWQWSAGKSTQEQRLIMRYGLARSPQDAQRLMIKTGKTALQLIENMPRRKRRNPMLRWIAFIRRLDGHDSSNPYKGQSVKTTVSYQYRYKKDL